MANRLTNITWMIGLLLGIIVSVTVWKAIYEYTGEGLIAGFTQDQTINYMIFVLLFGMFTYTSVSNSLQDNIRKGQLNIELLKPLDYGLLRLWQNISSRLYTLVIEFIPGLIIAVIFFGFHQFNPLMTIISIISISLAFFITYFFSLNWGLMYFKMVEAGHMEWLKNEIIRLLAGGYLPINFFPPIIQQIVKILPFQYILYVPARIFINSYTLTESIIAILIQVTWIFLLYATYKIGWHYSIKSFTGVGA